MQVFSAMCCSDCAKIGLTRGTGSEEKGMSEKLKARKLEMLRYLMTSTAPLDICFFEEKFHKSARTIRYDMNELKAICASYDVDICYLTKKGYFIPASQKMACSEILIGQKIQDTTGFLLDSDDCLLYTSPSPRD